MSDWQARPVWRAHWPLDSRWTEEQRAALCEWARAHDLDPDRTCDIAVEADSEDLSSGWLFARVHALIDGDKLYVDPFDPGHPATNSVRVPLASPPPVPGVPGWPGWD